MNLPRKVAAGFNSRAARYDNPLTGFIGERELRLVRRLVPAGCAVLDFGCGTGRTTLDHLRRGCQVMAYDISLEMLQRAENKARRAGFQAEFTVDPRRLEGCRWPVVTCIGVLDYYPDPQPLLRQLKSYLAPGGILVVTYPNALSPLAWLYALGSRLTVPAFLKTPAAARRAAAQAGLELLHLDYAFPAVRPIGHTLVLGLMPIPA